MKRLARSLGFAIEGLAYALRTELNLKLFLAGFTVVCLAGFYFHLQSVEWLAVLLPCGVFFSVELLNTAFERLVDTFDVERKQYKPNPELHLGLKATKDVAAAAALISFLVMLGALGLVFSPHVRALL